MEFTSNTNAPRQVNLTKDTMLPHTTVSSGSGAHCVFRQWWPLCIPAVVATVQVKSAVIQHALSSCMTSHPTRNQSVRNPPHLPAKGQLAS